MNTRTLRSSVGFKRPFKEERIDSVSVDAYRRLATRLYLQADPRTPGVREPACVRRSW
jgi:hypothetical protein